MDRNIYEEVKRTPQWEIQVDTREAGSKSKGKGGTSARRSHMRSEAFLLRKRERPKKNLTLSAPPKVLLHGGDVKEGGEKGGKRNQMGHITNSDRGPRGQAPRAEKAPRLRQLKPRDVQPTPSLPKGERVEKRKNASPTEAKRGLNALKGAEMYR